MNANNIFLFSIDLEDSRENVTNGHLYKDRVVENTLKYLNWLKTHNSTCTFFVVGKTAEQHPDLIKTIVSHNHEIGCHSYSHLPVNRMSPNEFKSDLGKNINALVKAGAGNINGYRAPIFSLTKNCEWVYNVLKDLGFTYSSSVLPAKSPLYGWKEFGKDYKKLDNGIIEFPISLVKFATMEIPFAGGVYFRVLPKRFIIQSFKNCFQKGKPALSYFHPYDLDEQQEQYMHSGINNNKFFNWLLYYNRKNLLNRLDSVMDLNVKIMSYSDYINSL